MITTVIFDLDGLLIDSEPIAYRVDCDLLREYGHTLSVEEYARDYSGRTGVANMIRMIERYSLPITVESGRAFVTKRQREYMKEGIPLKKGARELLTYLRENGYVVGLASSSARERAERILTAHGLWDFFDARVFGEDVKRSKPFPDAYLTACAKAGQAPENCLVLEDSEAGILSGRDAGMTVICVPDMKEPSAEYRKMAARVLGSLSEVVEYLEESRK